MLLADWFIASDGLLVLVHPNIQEERCQFEAMVFDQNALQMY